MYDRMGNDCKSVNASAMGSDVDGDFQTISSDSNGRWRAILSDRVEGKGSTDILQMKTSVETIPWTTGYRHDVEGSPSETLQQK